VERGAAADQIGMSMAQTGGLAAGARLRSWGSKSGATTSTRGAACSPQVELVVYDDKSSAAETPAIYAKLLDVDKVDLLFAPYSTVPTAPISPLVRARHAADGKFLVPGDSKVVTTCGSTMRPGTGRQLASASSVSARRPAQDRRFARRRPGIAQNPREDGARGRTKRELPIVFDQAYPPTPSILEQHSRAQCRKARHRLCRVLSRRIRRHSARRQRDRGGRQRQIFGGAMVGLQSQA